MLLKTVHLDRTALDHMPDDERTLLFLIGHLNNEISTLQRLLYWSHKVEGLPRPEVQARHSQLLLILRFLIGRLVEAHKTLKKGYWGNALSKKYNNFLSKDAQAAAREINRYFSKPNFLEDIRNAIAFHSDFEYGRANLVNMPHAEALDGYLGPEVSNVYLHYAEMGIAYMMTREADQHDHERGFQRLWDTTLDLTRKYLLILGDLTGVLLEQFPSVISSQEDAELTGLPEFDAVEIPFFAETGKS